MALVGSGHGYFKLRMGNTKSAGFLKGRKIFESGWGLRQLFLILHQPEAGAAGLGVNTRSTTNGPPNDFMMVNP